jgi:hypothetical protein
MRSPCVCIPFQFLKSGLLEPEETSFTVPCKRACDMRPQSRSSAVGEASRRQSLLGNGSVII